VQITLGVLVVLFHVQIVLALVHQATAIGLLGLAIYFIHRLRTLDEATSING
jgi:heme A synthase